MGREAARAPEQEAAQLRLYLLGGFRVERAGEPIAESAWKRRSAKALVKLLACSPAHRLHREQVLDLLWPDFDPESAANNLYQALHAARRALDPEHSGTSSWLRVANELVQLVGEGIWIDADAFQQAAEQGLAAGGIEELRVAAQLYGGELLPEDRYEEWAATRREGLDELHSRVLLGLGEGLIEQGRVGEGMERLRQVLGKEPGREAVHRRLMELCAQEGNRHGAIKQYQACREALRAELDAEPEEETERLYQAILAGQIQRRPSAPPHPAGPPRPRTNLPAQPTPFVGRERERKEIGELLEGEGIRLLTLTGAGGTGKTRLAIQCGQELLEDFGDGVYFVGLASISDPQLVLPTIAGTLGVREVGSQPLAETLQAELADKALLVILDNVEQVVEAAPEVAGLLGGCHRLKLLVTSREVLHLAAEYDYAVPPLALPDPRELPGLEALSQYDAVALFVQRAKAAKTDFVLSEDNGPAVAELCRRLDGLPLAIELAAARIRLLPPRAMLGRLESRLKLLTGGAKDLPERHQTLRAAIDWSYELLSREEQRLFARLSVFVGGCTLEAAEAVCNPEGALDVLEGMASLVDKSLVRQEGEEEPRFRMLETLREYAAEKLAESGEAEQVQRRHAEHFLELAERAEPELAGPKQGWWLEQLEEEHDNLRAALSWSVEGEEDDIGLRLAAAVWRLWYVHGHWSEGLRWLETVLGRAEGEPVVRAKALRGTGMLTYGQGDYERARELLEEGLLLYRQVGDKRGMAVSLSTLGVVAAEQGDYQRAALLEESLILFRELGDRLRIAQSLANLGFVACEQGDYERATTLLEEGLTLSREVEDKRSIADSLNTLGVVACEQGDYERAVGLQHESLTLFRQAGDRWGVALSLEGLGLAGAATGETERAARLWGAAEALRQQIGAALAPSDRARYERYLARAQVQLDEAAWVAAWQAGRAMTLEEAAAYALSEPARTG